MLKRVKRAMTRSTNGRRPIRSEENSKNFTTSRSSRVNFRRLCRWVRMVLPSNRQYSNRSKQDLKANFLRRTSLTSSTRWTFPSFQPSCTRIQAWSLVRKSVKKLKTTVTSFCCKISSTSNSSSGRSRHRLYLALPRPVLWLPIPDQLPQLTNRINSFPPVQAVNLKAMNSTTIKLTSNAETSEHTAYKWT